MKKILFVHCCYKEHISWIAPVIKKFLENGFACHLYPTHLDSEGSDVIKELQHDPNFLLIEPTSYSASKNKSLHIKLLQTCPVLTKEKQIAIESYREPAHRFLKQGEKIPEGAYDLRVFDIIKCNRRYRYDGLIAHGIHANTISSFAWDYLKCPQWVSDRGFIKGSVMLDRYSTETDDSELQQVSLEAQPLSGESRKLLSGLQQHLMENQTGRDFKKPAKGKNLLYALSRIRNEVNIKGCMKGLTELQIIKALSRHLPPDWNLIVKIRGKYKQALGDETLPENVYVAAGDTDVNYLIDMSDTVISFISKMGLEAGLKGKAVLTMGAAHYSHFGFTRDIQEAAQLTEMLAGGPLTEEEKNNLNSFLEMYLNKYLIFPARSANPNLERIFSSLQRES